MDVRFWVNDDIDMSKIVDSMQLDSEQTIATMTIDGIEASLEVRGEVKVWWNEKGNPMEGECYRYPSEFPDKLKRLIADGYTSDEGLWTLDPRVYVSETNWFELFVGKVGETIPGADIVDAQESSVSDLFLMLYEYIEDYKERG